MAKLQLTIGNYTVTTEGGTTTLTVSKDSGDLKYTISLVNFSFKKRIYEPTELLAELQLSMAQDSTNNGQLVSNWQSIDRKTIESTFKHKRVSLNVLEHDQNMAADDENSDGDKPIDCVGDDFYVHEVMPSYKSDSMTVKLKIYSLDQLLTIEQTCYSYTAKKVGADILKEKMAKYKKPYNSNETLDYDVSNMRVLKFVTRTETRKKKDENGNVVKDEKGNEVTETVNIYAEHMHPYLVQYNESFYEMLIRTCNRWGEFVYWEDGKLNVGYNKDKVITLDNNYSNITYPNLDSDNSIDALISKNESRYYFPTAADDSSIRDTNIRESKFAVMGKIFSWNGMLDSYIMQKIGSLWRSSGNLWKWGAGVLVEDIVDLCMEEIAVSDKNSAYNKQYFPKSNKPGTDEQYGEASFLKDDMSGPETRNGYCEFTEINTKYGDDKYREILINEQKAQNNLVLIDYDTTWPGLKLGNVIEVNGEKFIVVEIASKENETEEYTVQDNKVVKTTSNNLAFQVMAIGTEADIFYPPMLTAGHVRHSGPQTATIEEESKDDPKDQNRVRVAFEWMLKQKLNPAAPDEWIGDLSPWIKIASSDGGSNSVSRHYSGDSVLIGYIDNNIERPYVLGNIPMMGTMMNNVHSMSTPGMHSFSLSDGTGQGIVKFLSSAILPAMNTLTSFAPATIGAAIATAASKWDKNKYFEGGFTLMDKYGMYMITGSTDGRSVAVMSPWGDVMISAFTGINIMAPNGDINLLGKNVNITAGNKLTLTSGLNVLNKLKMPGKEPSTAAKIMTNVATAAAEALANKLLTVINVKLIRAIVETFFRPVEGTLTLKSLRFMKMEAGALTRTDFPAMAYNKDKKQKMMDEEKEKSILSLGDVNDKKKMSIAYATIEFFKVVKPFSEKLIEDFMKRYQNLIDLKKNYDRAIKELKKFSNDDQPVCKTYDELKADFWKEEDYKDWTEDKLDFKDNIKIKPENDKYAPLVDKSRLSELGFNHGNKAKLIEQYSKQIVERRTILRKNVLEAANKLKYAICKFQGYDLSQEEIAAFFKSNKVTPAIENMEQTLMNAANRKACPNSIIYIATSDKRKSLTDNYNGKVMDPSRKYLRRLIYYNLLTAFGFDKDSRRELASKNDPKKKKAIPEPDVKLIDPNKEKSLTNDKYWRSYVRSLSGVPTLKNLQSNPLLKTLIETFMKSSGFGEAAGFVKDMKERNIWGDGKAGTILFGAEGKTYEIKGKAFSEVTPMKPTRMTLSENDEDLKDGDKSHLNDFITELRKVLREK